MSRAPARSTDARRVAALRVTATARRRSSSAAARLTAPALACSPRASTRRFASLDVGEAKTKSLKSQLGKLGFGKTALVIDGDALNVGFARASSNLESVNLLPAIGANVYDIMRHDTLVLTRAAVEKLEARFNG